MEREGTDPHIVHRFAQTGQDVEGLANGRIAAADGDNADARTGTKHDLGRGRVSRGFLVLAQQAVHHLLIFVRYFGVTAKFVVTGSPSEERSFRMNTRQGSRCDGRAIVRQIPVKVLDRCKLSGGQYLAAIRPIRIVPGEFRSYPVVHTYIEIGEHE